MKHPLVLISCAISLASAIYISDFGSDTEILLQARAAPRLVARTNEKQRSDGRSPPRQAVPYAALVAEGPAKVFKNGPNAKKFQIPEGAHTQVVSQHTKNSYVDGRLLGEAPSHGRHQPIALHPMKVMANGRAASAQVTVPPKGMGFLKTTSHGESHTYFVPEGSEKKVRVESDTPGGAEAFASVTRPGKLNAEAQD